MTKARWVGLGIGVFFVGVMMGVIGLFAWQGDTIVNTAGSVLQQAGATPTATPGKGPKTQVGEDFLAALAKQLGITVDELKTKLGNARTDVIDQWVKAGKLTQDQADKLKERMKNAPGFGFGPFMPPFGRGPQGGQVPPGKGPHGGAPFAPGHGGMFVDELDNLEAIAQAVKLAPAELTKQFQAGKTLADIAKAQGVDEAVVKKAIIDGRTAQIDRAVKDGVMTQDQATKLKANLTPDKIDLSKIGGGKRSVPFMPPGRHR